MHRQQQQQQVKEVPRFREMTWLEPKHPSNAAASKPLLSPRPIGETKDKRARQREVSRSQHALKRPISTTAPCGLSHEEASTNPKPVLSMRKDANLGGTEARFQGKRTFPAGDAQCDAMIAPMLPIHDNWLETTSGNAVANMTKDTSKRFAYQKPSPLINLEYQTTSEPIPTPPAWGHESSR
ncbi:hypothetical protein BASA81_012524 [Batrachochytrium salamandrivorans]|nr:hypothetical protein BASA81_012524 [Batrachochytrium salamandrivorans]